LHDFKYIFNAFYRFFFGCCITPNDPYSPRRGESATQRARDRGGIGLLGNIVAIVADFHFVISCFHYFEIVNLPQIFGCGLNDLLGKICCYAKTSISFLSRAAHGRAALEIFLDFLPSSSYIA
jgi:hypothetical protein